MLCSKCQSVVADGKTSCWNCGREVVSDKRLLRLEELFRMNIISRDESYWYETTLRKSIIELLEEEDTIENIASKDPSSKTKTN